MSAVVFDLVAICIFWIEIYGFGRKW